MENLTPKIDDALLAVIEMLGIEKLDDKYYTTWGKKTEQGLKLSIINKLREYGITLVDEDVNPF